MKTIMCCLALLVALTVFTSAAFAQEPTLSSVEAKFDTTKDGKNDDSKLDVYLKNGDGQEVGKSEGNEGHWDKKSSHTASIKIEGNPTKAALANGCVLLTFQPHGADNWKFNYQVTLSFSDGSFIIKELEVCELTQYNTTRTDSF
jgi:hypothetical protein